jgi:hypothetical protein
MKAKHLLAAALSVLALSVSAQTLKPGLWQINQKMHTADGRMEKQMAAMQQQMAAMPPAKRKMMEDAMGKQGMQLGGAGPGGMAVKICMTKEMVERNEMPSQRGDCKTTKQNRSGNTMTMAFACTNPPSTGEGQVTFTSPEAYTMKMTVNSTANGKTEKMDMDASGKWLGADCGNIKPPPMARK